MIELRAQYEAAENIPLDVKFVGDLGSENLQTAIPSILAQDISSKLTGYHFVYDTTLAHPHRARLRVHVTKALRGNWYSVNDRVGFADRNPEAIIAAAIKSKAGELEHYKDVAGPDVRLLLVADRIYNSGKLTLDKNTAFDLCGFTSVYLLPYPEDLIVLNRSS